MLSSIINRFLYPYPNPAHYSTTTHRNQLIWIPASETSPAIPCFYFQASSSKTCPLIIWSHGNGCDIGTMSEMLYFLSRKLHINILIYEYPGYGLCTNEIPSEDTINQHTIQTYNFVRHNMKYPPDRIIFYGHSIGSGTACMMVSSLIQQGEPVGGLILQSPYRSLTELVKQKLGVFGLFIPKIGWNNLDKMKFISCPVLFMHGKQDNVIPFDHTITLYTACASHRKHIALFDNSDHNSIAPQDILRYVRIFLNNYFY